MENILTTNTAGQPAQPAPRFEVRTFGRTVAGIRIAGWHVWDTTDERQMGGLLFDTRRKALEYQETCDGAQRAVDATERARSTAGYVPTRATGWC